MRALLAFERLRVRRESWPAIPIATLTFLGLLSVTTATWGQALVSGFSPSLVGLVPPASAREVEAQWASNLSQIGILLPLIAGSTVISPLVSSGTATLLATRPVSRPSHLWAGIAARLPWLAAGTFAGLGLTAGLSLLLYGQADAARLAGATATWFVLAASGLTAAAGLSAWTASTLGAAGISIGVLFAATVVGALAGPGSTLGFLTIPQAVAAGQSWSAAGLVIPCVIALGVAAGGARSYGRRDL